MMSLGQQVRKTVASSRALTRLADLRFVVFRRFPRLHDLWCIFVSPLFHPELAPARNCQPGSLDRCGWSAKKDRKRICIFSTNDYGWGGSEVALLRLTEELSRDGEWEILLCMNDVWPRARLLEEIVRRGRFYFYGRRRRSYGLDFRWRSVVRDFSPDFLLMGNGCLIEARRLMKWCIRQSMPFANCLPLFCEDELAQFGERNYRVRLPHLLSRSRMVFSDNESTFALLRRLFGGDCPPCTLVSNAPDVDCDQAEDWPADDGTVRLLCMCRLTAWHKGLDLLVEVLSFPKWRARPLFVDIYGVGEYAQAIERAIRERGIKATLNGYVDDYAPVIHRHHAGLFCSRKEGTPVVLTSYMLCHRMSIGTPVGGLPPCIVDGETGFLAESASAEAIDAALERAWNARSRWREMGLAAGRLVRRSISGASGGAVRSFIRKTLKSGAMPSRRGAQMRVAYLIDKHSIGGGVEYIQRRMATDRREGRESRVFYSSRRECTVAELDGWKPDEIVVNHLRALLQLLCNPWRRPACRVTFVVHGLHVRKYEWMCRDGGWRGLWARLAFPMRRTLEAWLYRRCDRIVVETESDRSAVRRLYGELPVSVEHNTLGTWRPILSKTLPLSVAGPFKYLCIARFDYQKGQDRWIREISKKEKGKGEKCGGRTLFIGDGPMLEKCRRLARKLGVADLCVFAGAIPDADRYLKCAEVVVSPSRWEGMPYLMMKARALGCRILATDCPGNRDVLAGYDKWERLEL